MHTRADASTRVRPGCLLPARSDISLPPDVSPVAARVSLSHCALSRNAAQYGGAVFAQGCSTEPLAADRLRADVALTASSFAANTATGPDGLGGVLASALGTDTAVAACVFAHNSDSCDAAQGSFYINTFSDAAAQPPLAPPGCSDTLSVNAELAPPCEQWSKGLVHETTGGGGGVPPALCVPLAPNAAGPFCCAPSAQAPLACAALITQPDAPFCTAPSDDEAHHHGAAVAAPVAKHALLRARVGDW
jgi:hypothetical protein